MKSCNFNSSLPKGNFAHSENLLLRQKTNTQKETVLPTSIRQIRFGTCYLAIIFRYDCMVSLYGRYTVVFFVNVESEVNVLSNNTAGSGRSEIMTNLITCRCGI